MPVAHHQQPHAAEAADVPAIEAADDLAAADGSKPEGGLITLCHRDGLGAVGVLRCNFIPYHN